MNIQRFHAPTAREALAKARMTFGEGTLIISNRPTANGVEVMATTEDAIDSLSQRPAQPLSDAERSFDSAAAAQMERIVVDLRRMYQERNEALREVTRAHHEALLRLALAADFRDDDTGVHMVRIGYLAEALATVSTSGTSSCHSSRSVFSRHTMGVE